MGFHVGFGGSCPWSLRNKDFMKILRALRQSQSLSLFLCLSSFLVVVFMSECLSVPADRQRQYFIHPATPSSVDGRQKSSLVVPRWGGGTDTAMVGTMLGWVAMLCLPNPICTQHML